jgi:hypothetical protein
MGKLCLQTLFLIIVFSCSKPAAEKPDSFDFSEGKKLAELTTRKIEEASGLAASKLNEGMLWVHNDSGNPAEIFLIDQQASVQLVCKIRNAENRDWEDIAVGPGPAPGKSYVYVGDIGDNMAQYPYKIIYRFEEPDLKSSEKRELLIDSAQRIVFRLSDKVKDSEALMIEPATRDLYVVSKRENPVVVYKIPYPQSTSDTITASPVCTLPLSQIVAGDISSDGKQILLKNYQNVFFWRVMPNETIPETLRRAGKILPYKEEAQGEAIAFATDGSGYFTISENSKNEKTYLRFYERK